MFIEKQGQKLLVKIVIRMPRNISIASGPLLTKFIFHTKKKLHFYNITIPRNFYQNRLIDKCARKNLAKRALCDLS